MKSETQRPGHDSNFDEHANEDGYFALKEREIMDDMKAEFRKDEAARQAEAMATCPKCAGTLTKYTVKGFVVERCESCEGIWLNKGELAEILRRQAMGPLGTFIERCFAKVAPKES